MARTKDNPQSRELRQRLLHTAGEVFAEQGFRAATVRQITERAGVNLAAINYHFSDKAELYACALREAHCNALGCLLPDAKGSPRERLRAFLTAMLNFLLDPARPAWQNRLLAREIAEPTPALDPLVEGMRARSERLKAIVRDLAGTSLPTQQLALICASIMGQCIHYAQNGPIIARIYPVLDNYHARIDLLAEHITEFSAPAVEQAGRRRATPRPLIPTHERRTRRKMPPPVKEDAAAKPGGRRRIVLMVLAVLALVGLLIGVPAFLRSRNFVSTDDAFIEGHVVQINPKVSAYVSALHFDDNMPVNKGDLLVELDPRDYDVALQKAWTQLAQSKAQVLQARAGVEQSRAKSLQAQAQVTQQEAEVTQANAQSSLAGVNFNRDTSLYTRDIKAIAKTNVDTTKSNYDAAQAMVNAAKANLGAARANVEAEKSSADAADAMLAVAQASVDTAEAGVRDAELQLSYTKIAAPVSGRVTRKAVEPGDYVTGGQALFSVVPREMWVTANFKETQLTFMRPGQPVEVEVDAFPGHALRGKVDSVQKGTGARFSLLPPENATGNYVKVIQRVPVKIVLEESPERLDVLSPGMSVEPRVDISSGRERR